jgi:hypothetical protein
MKIVAYFIFFLSTHAFAADHEFAADYKKAFLIKTSKAISDIHAEADAAEKLKKLKSFRDLVLKIDKFAQTEAIISRESPWSEDKKLAAETQEDEAISFSLSFDPVFMSLLSDRFKNREQQAKICKDVDHQIRFRELSQKQNEKSLSEYGQKAIALLEEFCIPSK